MNVSRSGYYKYIKREGKHNSYERVRESIKPLIKKYYISNPTWGSARVNKQIKKDYGIIVSNNLVWKCRNKLGLQSVVRKKRRKNLSIGEEHTKYPNILKGNFNTDRPFEKIVSDTTMIGHKGRVYDFNVYLDLFNNEIISYDLSVSNYGFGRKNHYAAAKLFLIEKEKRGYIDKETIFHSDQGSIYASQAFNALFDNTTIVRSMSRAGCPTDHPGIESFNGWMKDELEYDFKLKDQDCIYETVQKYVTYHNNERLAYALDYKSPFQFKTEKGFI